MKTLNMEKTAMQQAIEFVEKEISELNPEMKSDHHKSVAYKTMIEEMKKLRYTVEKEQIIKARSNGDIYTALALGHTSAAFDWYEKASLDCANKYYEQTYGNG